MKGTAVQAFVAGRSVDKLIDIQTSMPGVIAEATELIAMHFYDRRKQKYVGGS